MQKHMYSGCIDTVGGQSLVFILKRLVNDGSCYIVGFGRSNALAYINLTAFVLRGIKLIRIHTENINRNHRDYVWNKIALFNKINKFPNIIYKEIKFNILKKIIINFNQSKIGGFLIKIN